MQRLLGLWSAQFSLARPRARFDPRLLASALLALTACSDDDQDQYPVAVSWAVNGLAPSEAVCDQQGVERIELSIRDGAQIRTIEGDCTRTIILSDGYEYGGFVTTESFYYDVLYSYELSMLGSDDSVILHHTGTFETQYEDFTPVELPTLEVFAPIGDVSAVTGSFSAASGELAQACVIAGVNRVELWVYSVLDFDLLEPVRALYTDCVTGALDSGTPLLDFGDYQVTYVALAAETEDRFVVVDESEPISVYVDREGTLDLPHVTFTAL